MGFCEGLFINSIGIDDDVDKDSVSWMSIITCMVNAAKWYVEDSSSWYPLTSRHAGGRKLGRTVTCNGSKTNIRFGTSVPAANLGSQHPAGTPSR